MIGWTSVSSAARAGARRRHPSPGDVPGELWAMGVLAWGQPLNSASLARRHGAQLHEQR